MSSKMHSLTSSFILISFVLITPVAHSSSADSTTTKQSPANSVTTATTTSSSQTTPKPTVATTTTTSTSTSSSTSTTTTTVAPTTPTEPPTTTTEPAARLGENCTDTDWCNTSIVGQALCDGGFCACDSSYFRKNNTACLPNAVLEPVIPKITDANITSTSLAVQWQMKETLFWRFNVTCTGIRSGIPKAQTDLNTMTAEFTGLTPGDEYNVTVIAYFTNDENDTKSGAMTVIQAIDPAVPGNINKQIKYVAPNISLQWNQSEGYVNIYMVTIEGTTRNTTDTTSAIALTGRTAGKTYDVTIVAENHGRTSVPRNDTFMTEVIAPGAPSNLANISKTQTSITLKWDPPTDPNGNLTGYLICYEGKVYQDLADYSICACRNTGNVNQFEIAQLTPGAFYDFKVYSVNTEYNSTDYANLTAVRTSEDEPGRIGNLSIKTDNLSFHVTWQRPAEPNGDIIQYMINWQGDQINCTDYVNTQANQSESQTNSGNCSSNHGATIAVNEKDMNYTITGLAPFSNYTVTVTPYTSVGPGVSESIIRQTSTVKPEPVTNVVATPLNSTAVMVNWTIPETDPGPVIYTVKSFDMIRLTGPTNNLECTADGYEMTSCIVAGLEEYWVYQFLVEASTDAGVSESERSDNTTTKEGVPTAVQNFGHTLFTSTDHCDATEVQLEWNEPDLLDRNSKIVAYVITDRTVNAINLDYTVEYPAPYRQPARQFRTNLTSLNAETRYNKKIKARTEGGVLGAPHDFHFTTVACAPPDWPSGASIKKTNKQTTTSFTITLPGDFFINNDQGTIKETGLIISKKNENIIVSDVKVQTWKLAKENSFNIPYAITFEVKNENRFEVTVGQNETCSESKKSTTECNGQLPPNQQFYVMAYACTGDNSDKCTASHFYGAYQTAAVPVEPPESSSAGAIVAGVLVAVGLIIVIGALIILQRRGVINVTKLCHPGPAGPPPDSFDNVETKRPMPSEKGPIKLSEFDNYTQELHKDTNLLFSCQYEDIMKLSKIIYDRNTTEAANLEDNKAKNRWVNILPFDHSRVKLQQLDDDDPTSDYINANYIPGFQHQRDYIATQGPLPGTIDDFWRMIWEHNVAVIVMLTQCKEGNRVKCEPYWPNEVHEPKQYGEVVVDPVSISTMNKYNITIFHVSVNNVQHTVHHFHYLEFPDMSANVEYDVFLEFLQVVRSHIPRNVESPVVVHCSAGVGRTGTFIALDRLSQTLSRRDFSWDMKVDIFDMVIQMRNNRTNMVQTESQYIMIHDCLNKMLEVKKRESEVSGSDENLYVNQAYGAKEEEEKNPYPELLYENLKGNEMKTDL